MSEIPEAKEEVAVVHLLTIWSFRRRHPMKRIKETRARWNLL